MALEKFRDFLIKHQLALTCLRIFVALVLLLKLIYDEAVLDRDNLIELMILVGIVVLSMIASYLNRRRQLISHFILESSDVVNLYALDLNYRYMALTRHDIKLVKRVFDFTPRIGDTPLRLLDSENAAILKCNVDRARNGETFTVLSKITTKHATYYWQNFYSPIYNHHKKIIGVFCVVIDVTQQYESELSMQKLAYEDVLTTVHNRRYIEIAFNECVLNKVDPITIIMSDLNKFKEANDTYGHACGDQILKDFGKILTKVMPEEAVVARLGGDEFAVLLPGVSEKQAEFLMNLVKIEMMTEDMPVTVSLGSYTDSYEVHKTFVDFCACADERMYRDKNQKG